MLWERPKKWQQDKKKKKENAERGAGEEKNGFDLGHVCLDMLDMIWICLAIDLGLTMGLSCQLNFHETGGYPLLGTCLGILFFFFSFHFSFFKVLLTYI